MILTVNKYLNTRIGEPSTNAVCNTYKMPGDNLDIDKVVTGSNIDGNSIWYHCKDDNCFYWSGGISEIEFELENQVINEYLLFAIAKDIQNNHYFEYSKKIEGYKGCGIGYKNFDKKNTISLIFFVATKNEIENLQNPVPEFIVHKGVKMQTDVTEVKESNFQLAIENNPVNPDPDNISPLQMGGKIFQQNHSKEYGTRTAIVKKGNKKYILSCCHVMMLGSQEINFRNENFSNSEVEVVVPDLFNQVNYTLKVSWSNCQISSDYALADADENMQMQNFFNGRFINDIADEGDINLLLNHEVESIGRVSGLQTGTILATSTTCEISGKSFQNIIMTTRMSTFGDSGAPVVKDNLLIGFVFAGDDENYSYIIPVHHIKGISF